MHLALRPFLALWLLVAAAVIVVACWRYALARREDDTLHLAGEDLSTPAHQAVLAQKLQQIDKWGKLLTVIALVYGLLLAAAYLYKSWVQGPGAGL